MLSKNQTTSSPNRVSSLRPQKLRIRESIKFPLNAYLFFFNVLLHACGLRHLFALSHSIFLIIKLIVEAIKSSFIILYSFLYISCLCVFGPGELTINVFFNRQIFNLLCGVLRDLQLNVYYESFIKKHMAHLFMFSFAAPAQLTSRA